MTPVDRPSPLARSLPHQRASRCTDTAQKRVRPARRFATVGLVAAALLSACGGSDEVSSGDSTTTSSTTTSTTSTEATSSTEATTSTETTETTEATGTTGSSGSDSTIPTGSVAPVSVPQPEIETSYLTAVDVGRHEGYERVVFEFDGELPGYDIGYIDLPLTQDGSGDPIDIGGDHAISVRMAPTSGVRLIDDGYEETYTGPDRVVGGGSPVIEVVRAGDFEAQATWAIVVDGERPFAVSTLTSPTRIVIDVIDG